MTVALLVGGVNFAWADETVGATDCSTGLDKEGSYSESYTIKGDGSIHFTFVNHNNGGVNNWENWYLYCASNDKATSYFKLRADNWEDNAGANTNCVSNYDWDNFVSDMNGATIDMYVSRLGSIVTVSSKITTTSDKTYYYSYTYVNTSMSANITVWLGVCYSYMTISTADVYRYNSTYSFDFNNSTNPFSYSSTNNVITDYPSSANGGEGNLMLASEFRADRTMSLSFAGNTDFTTATDYVYEFDWNASSSNSNGNTLTVAGASGTLLTVSQGGNVAPSKTFTASSDLATHAYANARDLTNPTAFYHFIFSASTSKGIYLTILYNKTTVVVANQRIADFTTIASIQDVCGKSYHHVIWDDLSLKTASLVGVVATPTYEITGPDGTSRKFTLSCPTANTTIYYATSDLEKGDAGWTEYSGEVTTAASTIYAYAKDEDDYTSSKMNFATGVGTAITLNNPTFTPTALTIQSDGLYYPTMNASYSSEGIAYAHTPSLSATFNGSPVVLPYAATTAGTLVVTATCEGYTSSSAEYDVVGYAKVLWKDYTTYNTSTKPDGIRKWSNDSHWEIAEGYGYKAARDDGNAWLQIDILGMAAYDKLSEASGEAVTTTIVLPNNHNTGNDDFQSFAKGTVISKIYYFTEGKSVTTTATGKGFATLYTDKALDFSGVDGLSAYTATCDGSTVTLTKVNDVPANTGVVLMSEINDANTVYAIPVAESSSTAKGVLTGNASEATACNGVTGHDIYMLALNGEGKVQFTKVTSGEIAAGKAYLPVTNGGSVKAFNVVFAGNEETAISETAEKTEATESLFDLSGRRVNKAQKGLYIVNGKKVVVK